MGVIRVGFISAGLLLGVICGAQAQAATAVPQLNLNRFLGEWFEVARLPAKSEKHCVQNAFALYAAGEKPGRYSEVHSCLTARGETEVQNQAGRQDKSGDGKLRVTHLFLFHHNYWILALADDKTWALMGNPNHKELWLLSSTATMDPVTVAMLKAKAAAEGYDVSKLVDVSQTKSGVQTKVVDAGK